MAVERTEDEKVCTLVQRQLCLSLWQITPSFSFHTGQQISNFGPSFPERRKFKLLVYLKYSTTLKALIISTNDELPPTQ